MRRFGSRASLACIPASRAVAREVTHASYLCDAQSMISPVSTARRSVEMPERDATASRNAASASLLK